MTEDTLINRDALHWVLGTPQGRKVIWDLLATFGVFHSPRVPMDPEGTAFNCGMQNAGLILYSDCLTVSPSLTAMMIKELGNARSSEPEPNSSGPRSEPGTNRPEPQPDEPDSSGGTLPFTRFGTDLGN